MVNQRYGLLFIVGGSATPIYTLLSSMLCYAPVGFYYFTRMLHFRPRKLTGSKNMHLIPQKQLTKCKGYTLFGLFTCARPRWPWRSRCDWPCLLLWAVNRLLTSSAVCWPALPSPLCLCLTFRPHIHCRCGAPNRYNDFQRSDWNDIGADYIKG